MISQRIVVQFGSGAAIKVLGMISSIFVARIVGPEVLGIVAYGLSYASIFTIITGIWGSPHIKLVSEGRPLPQCMGVFVRLKVLSFIIFIFAAILWILISKYLLNIEIGTKTEKIVVYLSFIAVISHQLVKFLNTTYQAKLHQIKANLPNLVRGITFNVGRIIVVILGFTAVGLVIWDILAGIIGTLVTIYLLREIPIGKWDSDLAKQYWKYAKPLILFMVVTVSFKYLDKVVLAYFTNAKEVGYYAVAFSLGGILLFVKGNIGVIFFPLFSKHLSNGSYYKITAMVYKYQQFIVLFILPLVSFSILISHFLITSLYGNKFMASIIPFSILIFSSYINLLGLPFSNIVSGAGKFTWITWISIIKTVSFFIILIVLISPDLLNQGAIVLALSMLFAQIVETIFRLYFSRKIIQIKLMSQISMPYIIIITIAILFFIFGNRGYGLLSLGDLAEGIIFLIITYSLLYILSILKRDHIIMLLQILSLNKMLKYIKSEFKSKNHE